MQWSASSMTHYIFAHTNKINILKKNKINIFLQFYFCKCWYFFSIRCNIYIYFFFHSLKKKKTGFFHNMKISSNLHKLQTCTMQIFFYSLNWLIITLTPISLFHCSESHTFMLECDSLSLTFHFLSSTKTLISPNIPSIDAYSYFLTHHSHQLSFCHSHSSHSKASQLPLLSPVRLS